MNWFWSSKENLDRMSYLPSDVKALATIAILMDRRDTWSVITYNDLGKRIDHPPFRFDNILDRVAFWCHSKGLDYLTLLVITEKDGNPARGMYANYLPNPVTPETYPKRRVDLWRDAKWSDVKLPTIEEITIAYAGRSAPED
jgi:hypothetical protein